MPDSLDAALVFAFLVVPGYQIVRGYAVARGADAPPKDLYVLAQTIVASLAWLAVTWVFVEDLLRWVSEDELGEHTLAAYAIAPLVVGVPYAAGRGAGVIAQVSADRSGRLATLLRLAGLGPRETTWEIAWARFASADGAVVTLALDDGRAVTGQFGPESFVDAPPATPAVYLERAYELREDGTVVTYPGGVYVDGTRIVAAKFKDGGGA